MKQFTSEKQKMGQIGEDLAERFLIKQGFFVHERNFTKPFGEIDIVSKKDSTLHFIEVKTVSCENITDVSQETIKIRPEEQFHFKKFQRFTKTINAYLVEKNVSYETHWEIDLLTVYVDIKNKEAKVIPFWNVIL